MSFLAGLGSDHDKLQGVSRLMSFKPWFLVLRVRAYIPQLKKGDFQDFHLSKIQRLKTLCFCLSVSGAARLQG
jgi:hypothetical protein